jgi:hypothetical protein
LICNLSQGNSNLQYYTNGLIVVFKSSRFPERHNWHAPTSMLCHSHYVTHFKELKYRIPFNSDPDVQLPMHELTIILYCHEIIMNSE